jgi:HK97 family phage major capsid protein
MSILRREIHPEIRVLDEKQGLVEYVASDQSIDSYGEIIRADGWRFDNFQNNAPFVDSHNYSSVENLLGRVVDFRVSMGKLVETVKWAIDVGSNELAQLGFGMVKGGYLRAVSVGFQPMKTVSKYDRDLNPYQEMCEEMGVDPSKVQAIYLEQQQLELSACIIGANPNALAKSYAAGVLTDARVTAISSRHPEFSQNVERALQGQRGKVFSFGRSEPTEQKTNMRKTFLQDFERLSGPTKAAFDQVELSRRTGDPLTVQRSATAAHSALRAEARHAFGDPIQRALDADPELHAFWNAFGKKLSSAPCRLLPREEQAFEKFVQRDFSAGLAPNQPLGNILFDVPVSATVLDLMLTYGAFHDLSVIVVSSPYTRIARVTALPDAVFMTVTTGQGNVTIPADASFSGRYLLAASNTVATRLEVSLDWANDVETDVAYAVLSYLVKGLAKRLDYGAFMGNGNDDQTNGAQIGLFSPGLVGANAAAAGGTTIQALLRSDFLSTIAAINPAALQRPCRWYINPSFLTSLALLKDGPGDTYLLRGPSRTRGEWELCDFPITWTAVAPSTNQPGKQIALFGEPESYNVVLRQQLEIKMSDWADGRYVRQVRALMRGKCEIGEQTGFAVLSTAVQ